MSQYHDLVSALRHLVQDALQKQYQYYKGKLGNGLGDVDVPGREGFSYVQIGGKTLEIFNKAVRQGEGTPVIVGTVPWMPDVRQVLSVDWEAYLDIGWGNEFGGATRHGTTHEWRDGGEPGSDTFHIYRRQLFPLRCEPLGSGSTSVLVNPYGFDDGNGSFRQWPGTPGLDLAGAVPSATGTSRFALVYWDYDSNDFYGGLGVATGTLSPVSEAILPVRPVAPIGTVLPSAWVKLQGGQSTISETDIYDARPLLNTIGTVSLENSLGYYTGTPLSVQTALDQVASVLVDGGPKVSKLWTENLQAEVLTVNNLGSINASASSFLINFITTGGMTSTGDISITTGDYFSGSEDGPAGAGIFERANLWQTPDDHFNTFSGWTWDSTDFDGAPSTVDLATFTSLLRLMNDSISEDHFAYKSGSGATVDLDGRLAKGVDSYVGLRVDDGTDDNYAEIRIVNGTATGKHGLERRHRVSAGSVVTATLVDDLEYGFINLRVNRISDTAFRWYYRTTSPVWFNEQVIVSSVTWTTFRYGVVFGQRAFANSADRVGLVDLITHI